jgi:hypothetical protein
MQHLQALGSGAVLVSGNELQMAIKAGEWAVARARAGVSCSQR